MTAPQVARTFKATPLIVVVHPKYVQHPAARTITTHVMDAPLVYGPRAPTFSLFSCPAATYPLGHLLRQPAPVSFCWKETGTSNTAAALIAQGFAAIPLVTIGVTNADVTSNSAVDDGAANHGMDCT
jgi:ABC-type molybdate transport system permease subunit